MSKMGFFFISQLAMITGDNPLTACHVARELRLTKREILLLSPPESAHNHGKLWSAVCWEELRFPTMKALSVFAGLLCCESTRLPPMWLGFRSVLDAIRGLRLMVIYSSTRCFHVGTHHPLSPKTNICLDRISCLNCNLVEHFVLNLRSGKYSGDLTLILSQNLIYFK